MLKHLCVQFWLEDVKMSIFSQNWMVMKIKNLTLFADLRKRYGKINTLRSHRLVD